MDSISVGIYDEHNLMQQGISSLLADIEEIKIVITCTEKIKLLEVLRSSPVNVLIFNIHNLSTPVLNLITQLGISVPKMKILVLSILNTDDVILKSIKAGAKGFLSKESDKNELIEAIYTLRNGHDYYSKSITHILLNKYISKIKSNDQDQSVDIQSLSSRQVEILKFWGEGFTNKDIADKLFISIRTVESHKNHIMQKLNLKTSIDMVKFAIKNNLIEI
jgi:DNA-binding NarL/FixJ family response regulator